MNHRMVLPLISQVKIKPTQVEQAVQKVLQQGLRTGDIFEQGTTLVSCSDMGDAVIANL